jgi:hypothetical protein
MLDTLKLPHTPLQSLEQLPPEPSVPSSEELKVAWPDAADLLNAVQVSGLPEISVDADKDAWKYLLYSLKLRDPEAFDKAFVDLSSKQQGQFDAFQAYEDAWLKITVPEAAPLVGRTVVNESKDATPKTQQEQPTIPSGQAVEIQPASSPKESKMGTLGKNLLRALRSDRKNETPESTGRYATRNDKLLERSSPTAAKLRPYYAFAVSQFPELADTRLVRGKDKTMPYAEQGIKSTPHTVTVPLGEASVAFLQHKFEEHPTTLRHMAEQLRTTPEALLADSELLYAFVFLHELAHTVQYNQVRDDPEALNRQRRAEWDRLPVPNTQFSQLRIELLDNNSDTSKWVDANWQRLQRRYGISTKEELLVVQEGAQRKLHTELFADRLAADLLRHMRQEMVLQAA